MDAEQKLAELLLIVDQLVTRNEVQQILIGIMLDQNEQLAAQLEAINAIEKAMK